MSKIYGDWVRGWECPACNFVTWAYGCVASICPKCGELHPKWTDIAVRWVVTKTGFFCWQWEGNYEKKETSV
jgi:hypothetical protein